MHRIGRTARMKSTGQATSFVTKEDQQQLREIERLLGRKVPLAPGSRQSVQSSHDRPAVVRRNERVAPGRPYGFWRKQRLNHEEAQAVPPARAGQGR